MARLPERIIELPCGRFRWRVMHDGKTRSGTASSSTWAARDRAAARIELGGESVADPTVRELVDMWLADVEHAASTAERRDIALAAVPAEFMARHVATVTPPVVAQLWRQMRSAGTGDDTILKARNALSKAFQMGIDFGLASSNPIQVAKPKSPAPAAKIEPPSINDVRRLLEHVADDVVSRSIDKQGNVTDGKNGATGHRDVRPGLPTFTALRRLERTVGVPWIFHHPRGGMWRPDWVYRQVRPMIDAAGITMRPYDLRHFAATQAIAAGRSIPDVAKMLGDNPATVMKTYAHAIPGTESAALAVAALPDGAG